MSKKPYKVRAKNYDEKLAIKGHSGDVIKGSTTSSNLPTPAPEKKKK
jgi:hypothetical protein